ncbi:hypothetical protein Hanom_Chr00s000001g01592461 [Helianthus anomalus]
MVVSDTLEGLGVPGGGAAAGRSAAGSKPADEKKKRKIEEKAAGASERKHPRLRMTRTTAVTQSKPAVVTEPLEETFSLFDAPTSSARDASADAGVNKEFTRSPSIEAVTEPSVQAEDVWNKTVGRIFDTASGFATGGAGFEEPSIQPGESELEFYYHTYTKDRSVNYHRPPWSVMQGDDISNDPSACRDILSVGHSV